LIRVHLIILGVVVALKFSGLFGSDCVIVALTVCVLCNSHFRPAGVFNSNNGLSFSNAIVYLLNQMEQRE
jgi:hypothetical protein